MNIGYTRTTDAGQYAAVILAAGLSSRMKDFKPLLAVDGRPAVTGLVETLRGAGISDIVVVTGHERQRLQEVLTQLQVCEAYNEHYPEGMFTSIQAGLAKAAERFPGKRGYFLLPVDCPLITIGILRSLMNAEAEHRTAERIEAPEAEHAAGEAEECFFVPTWEGKKGHPLLIPESYLDEVISYNGEGGLKAITDRHRKQMIRVPVSDEECLLDMDTPEGYDEILHFVSKGFKRDKLSVLSGRKRIFLVRHGETRQHDEPMFIGQYDVPLSEEGIAQANALADEIAEAIADDVAAEKNWDPLISIGKEPLPAIECVYSSDLQRASETAKIIADRINEVYRRDRIYAETASYKDLREISLGEWDGRPIREIRENFPEEYEERGQDLFTFKTGNKSENFYDMQYRAVRALRDILADDYARNIIIVCHSGVIRALENNLKGLRVDDPWEPLEKGDCRIWQG